MIQFKDIQNVDSKKMYEIYDNWATIAKKSYFSELKEINFSKCSHIVFAGMGGSGAIGDIFSAILSKTNTHVTVVKGYHLPLTVDPDSIVILTSISGNTIEIISLFYEAKKIGAKIICFSDGGKLYDLCLKNNIEHRNISKYHSPRASFTSFLYSMLQVLKPILPIKESDVLESIEKLEDISKRNNSKNLSSNNLALEIAEWVNSNLVIYYPWGLKSAAIRFKNSLQENSKMHVMIEDIIESSHNGIVAWDKKNNFQPILIRGKDDQETTKQRWGIMKEFLETKNIEYKEIVSEEGNILTKIICLIYILDYCSIFLAVRSEIDPDPVDAIDFVKRKLEEVSNEEEL